MPLKVVVVGAELAGLGAAIALFLNEVGAAIHVAPNATRILRDWGCNFDNLQAWDSDGNLVYTPVTLLAPIAASAIDIKPTNQGPGFFYNTVSMMMPILMQFFTMAVNGISTEFAAFTSTLSVTRHTLFRACLSLCYTFLGALAMPGYIWAFREDWTTSDGNACGRTWMALWLVMHVNCLWLDATTVVVPPKFMSFVMLTWIILNVSSSIGPFDLSSGLYRWGNALPAYELSQILLYIWTDGCNRPALHQSLSILFSWWVVGWAVFVVGMRARVRARRGMAGGPAAREAEEVEGVVKM
ncbi:hypothetical protein BO82DRAFT_390027 [Aspergillus uvarum CBS 121591]|uniref:DUF3533 domain-containing protein n=1 Tax=Aspergillus uvarum CBS 121591 TaxID=1448315 RepID=A0A319CJW2_9EURO|nr:hypothetical protein BO82DRAFT_390027 [Aspergillus uvarum CBS 121591]PYH84659.1 hypothetical protein BO82DRAFT_390027 [Aspergillus uvarum CBS 121591]